MQSIYLDYNSTTPVDPLVLDTMMPYFSEKFGNAASHTHAWGWTAAGVVEKARQEVAALINAGPEEIIFTSGATEAINLAMRGVMEVYAVKGKHLIVAATEHKAVLDTAEDLQRNGAIVDYLSVDREGRIDLSALEQTIRPDTVLVCVMMANNETGTMQPVEEIARICKAKETLFFCDTTQAIGKTRVDVQELGLHLCTISAHKMYGPKGIGALYVRRKEPRVKLVAEITGGGHERGLRSGTLNVPAIVGFGAAAVQAKQNTWDYGMHTSKWRTILEQQLTEDGRGFINGCIRARIPNTTNITFPGIKAEKLIKAIPEIGISMGSACSSALPQPSHVLKAMGLSDEEIYSSVRISLGKETTEEEIRQAILRIGGALEKLRNS
ncbi:MAG: cysteine desulfurase family protein [Bacteroidia bacterium]